MSKPKPFSELKVRRLDVSKYPAVVTAYREEGSREKVAVRFGISGSTVTLILRRMGEKLSEPNGVISVKSYAKRIRLMWSKGESCAAMARAFGRSEPWVKRALKSLGLVYEQRRLYKGGRTVSNSGYVLLLIRDDHPMASMRNATGYAQEHRLVVANHLGRPLRRDETVHHMNGLRTDNRIDNLQLISGQHGPDHPISKAETPSFTAGR